MSPNIPCCTVIVNFINNPRDCQNCHASSKSESPDSYNILEHADVTPRPCVKKIASAVTTYRDHYCGRKWLPQAPKIILPYPGISLSGEKLSSKTTYADHFRPFSGKNQQDNRGKIITHKPSIVCENKPFEGKSETKSAYKYFKVEYKPLRSRGKTSFLKQTGQFKEKEPFITTTTYSSEFKVPKVHQRTAIKTPKSNISVSKEPFKHVSQYKNEFKYPKMKKDVSEYLRKRPTYKPPTVPMDKKTTYNSSFSFKTPTEEPRTRRRRPDLRCKECKMHSELLRKEQEGLCEVPHSIESKTVGDCKKEVQNPVAGDGDKSTPLRKNICPAVSYRPEIGDCCINSSDKV